MIADHRILGLGAESDRLPRGRKPGLRSIGLGCGGPDEIPVSGEREPYARLPPQSSTHRDIGPRGSPGALRFHPQERQACATNRPRVGRGSPAIPATGRTVEVASTKPSRIAEEPVAPITNADRPTTTNPAEVATDLGTSLPAMDPMTLPSMPPMATAGSVTSSEPDIRGDLEVPKDSSLPTPPAPEPAARIEAVKPVAESTSKPARSRTPVAPFSDEDVIHSSEQYHTMFGRLGPQGGSLRIAAGADLELPTLPIEGAGHYKLVAEEGRGAPADPLPTAGDAPTSPSEWSLMFNLRSGSLYLEGLDVIVPDLEVLHAERVAIAGLLRGSKLSIVDCTLSLALGRSSASIFILKSPTDSTKPSTSEPAPRREAVIQIRDRLPGGSGGAGGHPRCWTRARPGEHVECPRRHRG